jgi:hypothetical protein
MNDTRIINYSSNFPSFASFGMLPQPVLNDSSANICRVANEYWQIMRVVNNYNCFGEECLISSQGAPAPLLANFKQFSKDMCALSINTFDRQTVKGNVLIAGEKALFEMNLKGEGAIKVESNLKDSIEASWSHPSFRGISEGNFKINVNPTDPNKISIDFKNSDLSLSGECDIGQSNELSCEVSGSSILERLMGSTVSVKASRESSDDETIIRLQFEKRPMIPLFSTEKLGSFEVKLNSAAGEFAAIGDIGPLQSGYPAIFRGNVNCTNNPHSTCAADLKIGSFELNDRELDIQAFFDKEPNKLSGKVVLNGEEKFAGFAAMSEQERDILYYANLTFDGNELQTSLKSKK